jgi:hypothetical protein
VSVLSDEDPAGRVERKSWHDDGRNASNDYSPGLLGRRRILGGWDDGILYTHNKATRSSADKDLSSLIPLSTEMTMTAQSSIQDLLI